MYVLTRNQVRAVDRISMEQFQIPGVVLMENAARGSVEVARGMLDADAGQDVLILCGGGNNGGDGFAIARYLHNQGHHITIGLCADPAKYKGDALINWQIVQAMKIRCLSYQAAFDAVKNPRLIIDAIFGTGLSEPAKPPFEEIVRKVAATRAGILAIDVPSGLDCDTGIPLGAAIRADETVTFVGHKAGFVGAEEFTGLVTVVDIGCPREAIEEALRMNP